LIFLKYFKIIFINHHGKGDAYKRNPIVDMFSPKRYVKNAADQIGRAHV